MVKFTPLVYASGYAIKIDRMRERGQRVRIEITDREGVAYRQAFIRRSIASFLGSAVHHGIDCRVHSRLAGSRWPRGKRAGTTVHWSWMLALS